MNENLTHKDIQRAIEKLRQGVPLQDCWTCDCLQGFLTQLGLDCREDASDLLEPLKISGAEIHGCLGCDPCPPAEAFSKYLRERQERSSQQEASNKRLQRTACRRR